MSELKTALDLTCELVEEVYGFVPDIMAMRLEDVIARGIASSIKDRLCAIPADAVEQIEELTAKVELLRTKLDAARRDVEGIGKTAMRAV